MEVENKQLEAIEGFSYQAAIGEHNACKDATTRESSGYIAIFDRQRIGVSFIGEKSLVWTYQWESMKGEC
eukprot:12218278-Ditylum_brightwellii.AAC.2